MTTLKKSDDALGNKTEWIIPNAQKNMNGADTASLLESRRRDVSRHIPMKGKNSVMS